MPQASVFHWREGAGWLVLAGRGDFRSGETLEIDSQVLGVAAALGPLVYLWADASVDEADAYLEHLNDLGGPSGYLLDVSTEKGPELHKSLIEAGIIILGDGPNIDRLFQAVRGPVAEAIEQAYANGAVIYALGHAAGLFGAWRPTEAGLTSGLGWLERSIITPTEHTDSLSDWLHPVPDCYGVSIEPRGALALCGDERVALWGIENGVKIMLGGNVFGK